MRVTIDFPDPLMRRVRKRPKQEGISVSEFVARAVERQTRRVRFPLLKSKEPGVLDLRNADIEKLL